ncbi:MAG TPA: hypothetical protein VMM38_12045 [Aridibacter sp.]|nr:hypothetical protein [Aridibacter sp.]
MLKGISGIAAFVLTFGLSVSLVGLLFGFTGIISGETGVSAEITNFLRQDIRNGNFRDQQVRRYLSDRYSYPLESDSKVWGYSDSVKEYVNASSSMNDASLPDDLRYAWREHMEAWQAHDELLGKTDLRSRGISGCCDEAFFVKYRESTREINETWRQVLRIAERYGANTRGMY